MVSSPRDGATHHDGASATLATDDAESTSTTMSRRGGDMRGRALSNAMVRFVMEYVVANPDLFQPMARATMTRPHHAWSSLARLLRSKLDMVRQAVESRQPPSLETQASMWMWEERAHPLFLVSEEAAGQQLKTKYNNEKSKLKVQA